MPPDHLKPYQFGPGKSGNPAGRAKGAERIAREAMSARSYTAKDGQAYSGAAAVVHCLLDIAFDEKERGNNRVAAAKAALDRGYGTPKQSVKITDDRAAAVEGDFDPEKMSELEIREALGAIATLKRLGTVAQEPAGDSPTEH